MAWGYNRLQSFRRAKEVRDLEHGETLTNVNLVLFNFDDFTLRLGYSPVQLIRHFN